MSVHESGEWIWSQMFKEALSHANVENPKEERDPHLTSMFAAMQAPCQVAKIIMMKTASHTGYCMHPLSLETAYGNIEVTN